MATIETRIHHGKSAECILIRSAIPSDAETLLGLSKSVMAEDIYSMTTPDELDVTVEQEAAWIQRHLDHPAHLVLVAEVNGLVVGLLDFSCGHRRRIAHTGEFGMSVTKSSRDAGVGRALLSTLLEWARQHASIEKVCLKVHATNARAIGLYRKMGFVEEGRAVRELKYGPHEYVDSILMAVFTTRA